MSKSNSRFPTFVKIKQINVKKENKYIEERRNASLQVVMVAIGPTRERKEDGDCWSSERKKEEDGYLRKADKVKNRGARKSRGGRG